MTHRRGEIRALHLHDAASVGRNLVEVANEIGQPWKMTDIPWYYKRAWSGPVGHLVKRTRRTIWDGTLGIQSASADVVHIHTGGLAPHARWLRTPWVLHLHGTDVRTRQYEPGWAEKLKYGAANADLILYSTPDLKVHAANLTDSAVYMPVTVRLDRAPEWRPVRDRIIFASRWEAVKGAEAQIEVARRLKERRPDLDIQGLQWGDKAEGAIAAGVTLVPKKSHDEYRAWLATASVVVGQMTDVLSVSELEALAIGVPTVSSAKPEYYPQLHFLSSPSPAEVTEAVFLILDDIQGAASAQDGPGFIREVHDAKVGVSTLLGMYSGLISRSRVSQ